MTTNEHLTELERDLEADLLKARRELEQGRNEAIGELNAHRDSLGNRAATAVEEIRSLANDAEADLKRVQGRLGELNYILAEDEMDDLEVFDRYRDRILGALREAKEDLSKLKTRGREWSQHEDDLEDAWHQLSLRLISVRKHLTSEEKKAEKGFRSEREQLSQRLEQAGREQQGKASAVDIVTRLRGEFQQALPGIKALFMYDARD